MMAILITGNVSGGHTNPAGTVYKQNYNLCNSSRRLDDNNYMYTERKELITALFVLYITVKSLLAIIHPLVSMFLLFFHSQFLLQY